LSSSESSPAAYARLESTILAQDEQRIVNVDVMYVVTLILGSYENLLTLRPRFAQFDDFDIKLLDDLDDMARALQHAHGLYLQATKSPIPLQALIERASQMRDVLHAEAVALSKRGVVNEDSLREVKRNTGHRALVVDLQILVQTLSEKLPALQGKSHVTAQELAETVLLIDTLTQAIGTKEHSPQVREQTIVIRAKALRMLADAWEEIRAALAWVRRREGDAEKFAASLYSNRSSGKPASEEPEPEAGSSTGVHPVVAEGSSSTPASSIGMDLNAQLDKNGPFRRTAES
jgi:hypothetical protein